MKSLLKEHFLKNISLKDEQWNFISKHFHSKKFKKKRKYNKQSIDDQTCQQKGEKRFEMSIRNQNNNNAQKKTPTNFGVDQVSIREKKENMI